MNMKRNLIIIAFAAMLSLLTSCGKEAAPFDDSKIWDAIQDLQKRVEALERTVADNVSAIQSMVSLGSVTSWEIDAETGKGVITLVGGKKITIDQNVKGYSLITVVKGEDDVWYWAVCKDGQSELLEIDGKNVPVTVTPALRISEDKQWQISVDGGKTWVDTGIQYQEAQEPPTEGPDTPEDPEVVFFKDVQKDGDYLILTLADGTSVKVAIVGEASFTAAAETLWFSRTDMEKSVAVEMVNVKAYTITEVSEGWKAKMDENLLYVTSPDSFEEYSKHGTIKALAVFETSPTPAILTLEVVYEPMFTFAYVNGKLSVELSEHTGEDFTAYVLAGWKVDECPSDVAAWFNTEASNLKPLTGSAEYDLAEIIEDYSSSEDYVVYAAPCLPVMQVTQGKMKYVASDMSSLEIKASGASWTFTNVRFDSANFTAEMDGPFFGGFFRLEDWNNYGRDNFIETLQVGAPQPYKISSYNGPANGFPDGEIDVNITPATEYVIWYLPEKASGPYVAGDFITYTFKTPDVVSDSSVGTPSFVTKDHTPSGFTADVTPVPGAYKTYAAIVKSAVIPETEIELVRYLISVNKYSSAQAVNTVSNYTLSAEDEVYLVAVSLDEDGKYGTVVKEKVELAELSFTEDLGVVVKGISYGQGDVTLSLDFIGDPLNITYFAETYTYYTDDVLQKLMALGQLGGTTTKKVSSLGGKLYIDGLTLGAEYTFYAVVTDAAGNSSYLYKYIFTPKNDIDYITSDKEDYEYGMPKLSGTCRGTNLYTLTLDVEMPDSCKKYWLFKGNYEYFTGDPWSDSDKLVTMQFQDVTVHTQSISGMNYEYMNSTSRIYMVWQDDKGYYHAIYEYNPKN